MTFLLGVSGTEVRHSSLNSQITWQIEWTQDRGHVLLRSEQYLSLLAWEEELFLVAELHSCLGHNHRSLPSAGRGGSPGLGGMGKDEAKGG